MNDARWIAWLCLLASFWATPAMAAALNKLSACSDLAKLQKTLQANNQNCRGNRGPIERALLEKRMGAPTVRLCFMDAPVDSLQGFDCLLLRDRRSASALSCYRTTVSNEITDFKLNYTQRYKANVRDYLAAASRCAAASDDSFFAPATLFGPPLDGISKFEFGFALPLGSRKTASFLVLHGYASLDPRILGGEAIEFIYMYSSK